MTDKYEIRRGRSEPNFLSKIDALKQRMEERAERHEEKSFEAPDSQEDIYISDCLSADAEKLEQIYVEIMEEINRPDPVTPIESGRNGGSKKLLVHSDRYSMGRFEATKGEIRMWINEAAGTSGADDRGVQERKVRDLILTASVYYEQVFL